MIDDTDEGQRLRGWITNSYAQIEFLLGDLIVRCREFSEYQLHTGTLPYGGSGRVKKVRLILKKNGPLDRFTDRLLTVINRFDEGHDIRNLLAHGFCVYLHTSNGDAASQFQKWHRQPDRDDAQLIRTFRLSDMASEKKEFVSLANEALCLFKEIHDHFGWSARPDS